MLSCFELSYTRRAQLINRVIAFCPSERFPQIRAKQFAASVFRATTNEPRIGFLTSTHTKTTITRRSSKFLWNRNHGRYRPGKCWSTNEAGKTERARDNVQQPVDRKTMLVRARLGNRKEKQANRIGIHSDQRSYFDGKGFVEKNATSHGVSLSNGLNERRKRVESTSIDGKISISHVEIRSRAKDFCYATANRGRTRKDMF